MIQFKEIELDNSVDGWMKTIGYVLVGGMTYLSTKLGININILLYLGFAMLLDTITGTWAAAKTGIKPTSDVGIKGIMIKVTFLGLLAFTSLALRDAFGFDSIGMLKIVIMALTVFEIYSIWGNYLTIKTGKPVKEFDAISALIVVIRELLLKLFNTIINTLRNSLKNKKDL